MEASTSTVHIEKSSATLVRQNFAKPNTTKISEIEKNLTASSELYYLRGVVNFHSGERRGLDHTKKQIQPTKQTSDVEFLIYTILCI